MKRRDFMATGSAALALATIRPGALMAQAPGDAKLVAALDRIFYSDIDLQPETATERGYDKGERAALKSQLDDNSPAGRARRTAQDRKSLAELKAIAPAGLSQAGKLQREVALYVVGQRLVPETFQLDSVRRPYPIFQQGGAYFSVPDFLDTRHTIETKADAEAYLARLSAFRTALDEDTAYQRSLAPRGVVAPAWSLDLTLGQMRKLRDVPAAQSTLVASLARRAKEKGLDGDWSARAAKIMDGEVYPALDRQMALLTQLRGTTPAGDGVWRLKGGEAIYAAALKDSITTSLSPEEVHQIGLRQVAEIGAQLTEMLDKAGYKGATVGQRLVALNSAPEQLYANTDAGRTAMIASLNQGVAQMKGLLPKAFSQIPDEPLEIRRVPPEIQDGASNGYYYRAPLDGSRPAIYWINLKDTADWPKYQLPSLTYHEGIPGHHLQLSYAGKSGEVPLMLRTLFISAYGEGWALYAEQLADELGGYSGLEKAGYLQSFLFRAARLVVDTGIHAKRWSREKATQYLVETVGFSAGRSQREVERYCTQPGQACSYKIGHNKWTELRQRAQGKLGDKFSLAWFHDVLKEGLMPLELLERRVDERIAERMRA
ncbi:uncharacterized protein (DUF885 family) [Novosphingobium chloroacetimidivorans]|uniref:Uncharacterized protein (DUF885 family) n=1 Tax=Novosphingobium chloroacetimidivorans TaxID=1428314 RepID=A0A7W7KCI8_9SPHN|nr:DUF885 family protein [Novosphingobium chloroacetimidivorans]MBB4859693.1 uncharacterized protein (DUF885 family) [Novosphingobium chloroacetimidivorans]